MVIYFLAFVAIYPFFHPVGVRFFLASDGHINKKQKMINKKESLNDVPKLQRRKIEKPLTFFENKYKDSKVAITKAYLTGGYTLKEIGEYFGCHYSTISRIVKGYES